VARVDKGRGMMTVAIYCVAVTVRTSEVALGIAVIVFGRVDVCASSGLEDNGDTVIIVLSDMMCCLGGVYRGEFRRMRTFKVRGRQ
jgi:hypothetical protein